MRNELGKRMDNVREASLGRLGKREKTMIKCAVSEYEISAFCRVFPEHGESFSRLGSMMRFDSGRRDSFRK